jgi:hypothetical protein
VVDGTSSGTEPVWPSEDGAQVYDGTTVFEKVVVPTVRSGYQGVRIAAALMTDSDEHFYNAWQAVKNVDHGDVDGWTDGIDETPA